MNFAELAAIFKKLEATPKRLEKTWKVMKLLSETEDSMLSSVILLVQGRVYPSYDEKELGASEKTVVKAMQYAYGTSAEKVNSMWREKGDLGLVAEPLAGKKQQSRLFAKTLTVEKVFDNIHKLAEAQGQGAVEQKVKLIAELLSHASAIEAKYVIRLVLGQLRMGVGEGILRDAIAWAEFPKVKGVFVVCSKCSSLVPDTVKCQECGAPVGKADKTEGKHVPEAEPNNRKIIAKNAEDAIEKIKQLGKKSKNFFIEPEEHTESDFSREIYNEIISNVQHALDVSNDFASVAADARKHGLSGLADMSIQPGQPVKVMLAQKAETLAEGLEMVGKPAQIEYKYDGFRMQIHKDAKGNVKIFTRRLENVTAQFPDVVKLLHNIDAKTFILDGEAVGYDRKTLTYMPFQKISQRIKRKYGIEELAKELPVEVNLFDVLYLNGHSTISKHLSERRKLLESVIKPKKFQLAIAESIVSESEKEIQKFYEKSLAAGNEGIMLKSLSSPYKPGSRVGFMVKFKPVMESLDLVIVSAEWGEGKRATWLTSYTLACYSEDELLDVGKVSTGLKEKESEGMSFEEMTKLLKPLIIEQHGRYVKVKPEIVIEVSFEEIQKSPGYSSGYALRFPRFTRLRSDRDVESASTIEDVKQAFESQKKIGKSSIKQHKKDIRKKELNE